jgi:uncharacterized protein with HEPN domain
MQSSDLSAIDSILKRGGEIYNAQKRFGADPSILSTDSAYFGATAMWLLQISLAAKRLSRDFRGENKNTAWARIDGWSETIADRYESLSALDLWARLEDLSELYGVGFALRDAR